MTEPSTSRRPPGASSPDLIGLVTVLVADPDRYSRRLAVAALRHGGYGVEVARTFKEAISVLRRRRLGAVVVDPSDMEAPHLVEDIRLRTDIPILVVSHLADEPHVVAALDAGADDYLGKPFGVNELLARLRAALRRTRTSEAEPVVTTPDFVVDLGRRRVRLSDGTDAPLTATEWRIVEALVRRPNVVVDNAQLLEGIWGIQARDKTNYLRVYVSAIRRKIEPDPSHPRYFITYTGLGHMFVPDRRISRPASVQPKV